MGDIDPSGFPDVSFEQVRDNVRRWSRSCSTSASSR
jgi:hypothetical protein